MTLYRGWRDRDGTCIVMVGISVPLDPRLDLFNHSPTGFNWGYSGSGPAQLALALLAHVLGNDKRAVRLHQEFKRRVIAGFSKDVPWTMTDAQIRTMANRIEQER